MRSAPSQEEADLALIVLEILGTVVTRHNTSFDPLSDEDLLYRDQVYEAIKGL